MGKLNILTSLMILKTKKFFNKNFNIGTNARIDISSTIILLDKSEIQIGDFFQVRKFCELRSFDLGIINIGNNVFLNNNVLIESFCNVTIGDNTEIGPNCIIIDHDHDYQHNFKNFVGEKIFIGSNVWIGANCIILKGVNIGKNSVIAAGTIVNENIPDNTLVYIEKKLTFRGIEKK